MIGTWVDQDEQSRIETTSTWTKNQNFITRKFAISVAGQSDLSGVQMIGWDPVAGKNSILGFRFRWRFWELDLEEKGQQMGHQFCGDPFGWTKIICR